MLRMLVALGVTVCLAGPSAALGPFDRFPTLHISVTEATTAIQGDLTPTNPVYTHRFSALAGQVLSWRFEGPSVRFIITYPDGDVEGPGIPAVLTLPQTGYYVLEIHSNLMAEDIYGPFHLTLTLK